LNKWSYKIIKFIEYDNNRNLDKILNDLNNIGGVEASAVASRDGLLICSTISKKQPAETFVAMSATMMELQKQQLQNLEKGFRKRLL